jgi:putative flavoprotein involved in K+ transport
MHRTSTTDTVVIGGGQAGLAASHELTERGIEHVVLERHEVAASWRRHTWDSLRLLTPNWMNVLPGAGLTGAEPDGFVTATAYADHHDR